MTTENGIISLKKARDHIRQLTKRLDYLEQRLADEAGSENALVYVQGEADAIRWALPVLEAEEANIVRVRRLTDPTYPGLYERRLASLYGHVRKLVNEHVIHDTSEGRRCGVDDRCDELGGAIDDLVIATFPPEDVELFLADRPSPDFLEWSDSGTCTRDSTRDYLTAALQMDAWERLFPDNSVQLCNPANTKPLVQA